MNIWPKIKFCPGVSEEKEEEGVTADEDRREMSVF